MLNGDDALLRTLDGQIAQSITWCGGGETCAWRVTDLEEHWQDHMECQLHSPTSAWHQEIPSLGAHMIYPVTMAAAVGRMYGLTDEQIRRGILEFEPTKMRMAILHRGDDITILNDTYNANPSPCGRRWISCPSRPAPTVLPCWAICWNWATSAPRFTRAWASLGRIGIDCLITVGKLGESIADGAESAGCPTIRRCANQAAAQVALAEEVRPGATILVKASRGMKFEHLVDYLVESTPECEE